MTDVYLSLDGSIIPNHGFVMISDIGTIGDDTALLCHTNRPANITNSNGKIHSGGDWFAPDETIIVYVRGLRRNRDPMVTRLIRKPGSVLPIEGIYHCLIEDDTYTLHTVTVGLYNNEGGNVHAYTYIYTLCIKKIIYFRH